MYMYKMPPNKPSGSFMFKGSIATIKDLHNIEGKEGDLYFVSSEESTYVCTDSTWMKLASAYDNSKSMKLTYPSNCKNCGAVLHRAVCDYCSTNNTILEE